jgi:hypothetical protein
MAIWLRLKRLDHDGFDFVIADSASAADPRLVEQTIETVPYEPRPPLAHGVSNAAQPAGDSQVRGLIQARQNEPCAEGQVVIRSRPLREPHQLSTLVVSDQQLSLRTPGSSHGVRRSQPFYFG